MLLLSIARTRVLALLLLPLAEQTSISTHLPDLPRPRWEQFEPAVRSKIKEAYEKARQDANNPESVGYLGMVLHAHQLHELAVACYQRAHLLAPESANWIYYLATAQAESGNHVEAISALDKALELMPDYLPAQLKLAELFLRAGKVREAQRLYSSLVQRHPRSALILYGLGQAEIALRNFAAAAESLSKACAQAPEFGAAHYRLALAYRDLGKNAASEEHLRLFRKHRDQKPTAVDPLMSRVSEVRTGVQHHLDRGLELQKAGRIEEAIAQYRKVLELDPERVQAHINLIAAHLTAGDLDQAEKHFQAVIKMNPELPEAHYNFGLVLQRRGDEEQAAQAFLRALESNPYFAQAHNDLGVILFRQDRLEEAEEHFRRAIENKTDYRTARYNLARVLLRRDKPEDAIVQLRHIVSVEDNQTPLFLYTLADAYARAGRLRESIETAREAMGMAASQGQKELAERIEKELEAIARSKRTP